MENKNNFYYFSILIAFLLSTGFFMKNQQRLQKSKVIYKNYEKKCDIGRLKLKPYKHDGYPWEKEHKQKKYY